MVALALTAASATGLAFAASFNEELSAFFTGLTASAVGAIAAGVAFAAVLGIEGYMVTVGMMKGIAAQDDAELKRIYRDRGVAAIVLLVVSCVAGLFQRSFLVNIDGLRQAIAIVLLLVAGVGIPVSIWLAAPSLGIILNFQNTAERTWLTNARNEFNNSTEASVARREMELKLKAIERQGRNEARTQNSQSHAQPQQSQAPRWTAAKMLEWYMSETNATIRDDLKAKQIAEAWAQATGYHAVNGDMDKIATAIRVELTRQRQKAGTHER